MELVLEKKEVSFQTYEIVGVLYSLPRRSTVALHLRLTSVNNAKAGIVPSEVAWAAHFTEPVFQIDVIMP